uniref:Kinetochore protein Nuf2 N-terminal domain-containing protein n=1 Tax=Mola mola TaxID=94237 RepID=A0A3Q3WEC5_MOLML
MAENTFPVYSANEILNFYRTEVLTDQEAKHFTKSDLAPIPKPEAVQTLYMRVLHLLYRFRPECHSMVRTKFLELKFLRCVSFLCTFLPMCLVYDFSLNDLLAPSKEYRADVDRLQAYTKRNLEAEKKIETLMVTPPEHQAEADELAAAMSELQAATMHECQEVNAKNDSIAELKTSIAEKTQKLAQLKMDVSGLKEDISKLKSQIVESPEELKTQKEKMRENVKKIKNSIEETDERVVELQNLVQRLTQAETEMQQMHTLLQDLESSMNNTKQRQEEYLELNAQYEKKQKELKNLCVEEGQLKRALVMRLDKKSKQNIRRQKKREMKEQHVQDVLGQCNQIQQKREEMAERIQEISSETQQLKAKIQSLRDVCSKETESAQALYDTLSNSMDELHRRIETHIVDLKCDLTKMSANV